MGIFPVALLTVIRNGYFIKKCKSFGRIILGILKKVQKNPLCHSDCVLHVPCISERSYLRYGSEVF